MSALKRFRQFKLNYPAVNGIDNAVSAENAHGGAIAAQKRLIGDFVTYLRPLVRRIKKNTGYTETIGEALGMVAASTSVDEASIKPVITLTAHIGFVRIRIQRKGAKSRSVVMPP